VGFERKNFDLIISFFSEVFEGAETFFKQFPKKHFINYLTHKSTIYISFIFRKSTPKFIQLDTEEKR